MKKSIVKFCLIVGILISTLCFAKVNASSKTLARGVCGKNLSWILDDSGILTIIGTGDMYDYSWRGFAPWSDSGNASKVLSVNIVNGVKSIGDYAFSDCTELTSVKIPDSVESIGYSAFLECENLKTVYWNALDVSGYPVVANNPFENAGTNGGLSVILGEGVETIPDYAFDGCTSLTNVAIPDSVTRIGHYAFSDCTSLTSVTITKNVTCIGNEAFQNCVNLDTVYWNSISLENLSYNSPFQYVGQESGRLDVIFGYGVETIPDYAFWYCRSLTSVVIPDTVTDIGDDAFHGCMNLTSMKLPKSIINIGDNAFRDCTNLTSMKIPEKVIRIGNFAFSGCTNLASMYWNAINVSSYPSITNNPFKNAGANGGLSVIFGDSVETIPDNAFYNCTSLVSVNIPESVTSIGSSAFFRCTGLFEISVSNDNIEYSSLDGVLFNKEKTEIIIFPFKKSGHYSIPDSVEVIPEATFSGRLGLTSVTIPENVKSIGNDAFLNCENLKTVYWNAINARGDILVGFSLFQYAGTNSGGLTVFFGDSVESIPEDAFSGCRSLTSVTISKNVTSIGGTAFLGCTNLKTVYWNAINVSDTGYMIFKNAGTITGGLTVNFGDSVETIPDKAFEYCEALLTITIPDSVTSIGRDAFYGCTGLMSVIIPDSVTSIGRNAFYGCAGLTSVIIPKSVTCIERGLFENCTSLVNITIPENVTNIMHDAFYGCTSLTSVTIPKSVTNIGNYVFYDCTSLISVTIPESVRIIGYSLFYGCKELKVIVIPENIFSINSNAFGECTQLEDVYFKGSEQKWNLDVMYNIDEGNENLLNANIHYNSDGMVEPSIYLSKTRVDVIGVKTNCRLGVASYNGNGLLDVKFTDISSNTTKTIEEIGVDTTDTTILKAFLWDGVWGIRPVCNSQTIIIK